MFHNVFGDYVFIAEGLYCPRTFDGWGCFNDTLAGQVAYIPCPDFVPGFTSKSKFCYSCSKFNNLKYTFRALFDIYLKNIWFYS